MIQFLHTGHRTTEIHHWLCHVYSYNIMSDSSVMYWCRKFRNGCTDVRDEGHKCNTQLWLTNSFEKSTKSCVKCHFTVSDLSDESSQISSTSLFWTLPERMSYQWGAQGWSKQMTGYHSNAIFFDERLQKLLPWYEWLNLDNNYIKSNTVMYVNFVYNKSFSLFLTFLSNFFGCWILE